MEPVPPETEAVADPFVPPLQLTLVPEILAVGPDVTVTVTVAVSAHPADVDPSTLYVVVEDGLACTIAPELVLSPVVGLSHVYVLAPLAVNVAAVPPQ